MPQKNLDVTIDGSWALSQQNGKFLMNLNTDVGLAIFATKKALGILLKMDTIIRDGTFKTAPRSFDQIYTFFAVFGKQKIPVCWALFKGKQQNQYKFSSGKLQEKIYSP